MCSIFGAVGRVGIPIQLKADNDRGHRYNCKIPCIRWTSPGGLYCYRHGLYTSNEWRIQRGKNTANSACKRPGRVVGHSFVFS